MSDETSPTPEDDLDDLALRHALGTLSAAERGPFETCLADPRSPAAALAAGYRQAVARLAAATAPPCAPPAPEVKARLFEALQRSARPPLAAGAAAPAAARPQVLGHQEGAWRPTPIRGVRLRELSASSPDYAVVLLSVEPGSVFPAHDHAGAEDFYLLQGEVLMEDRRLQPGDFVHWEAGVRHPEMRSPGGCEAMVITSRKNYSVRLLRAYALAHRLVEKVRQTIG